MEKRELARRGSREVERDERAWGGRRNERAEEYDDKEE